MKNELKTDPRSREGSGPMLRARSFHLACAELCWADSAGCPHRKDGPLAGGRAAGLGACRVSRSRNLDGNGGIQEISTLDLIFS